MDSRLGERGIDWGKLFLRIVGYWWNCLPYLFKLSFHNIFFVYFSHSDIQ